MSPRVFLESTDVYQKHFRGIWMCRHTKHFREVKIHKKRAYGEQNIQSVLLLIYSLRDSELESARAVAGYSTGLKRT